ncbi:hypothetical protein [Falsiroseomonas sp.]|uniref:hypothetical protein n=1 Tax=Falsiroseomonas sp. TaxID=2870721 RepID=UPI003F6FFB98
MESTGAGGAARLHLLLRAIIGRPVAEARPAAVEPQGRPPRQAFRVPDPAAPLPTDASGRSPATPDWEAGLPAMLPNLPGTLSSEMLRALSEALSTSQAASQAGSPEMEAAIAARLTEMLEEALSAAPPTEPALPPEG